MWTSPAIPANLDRQQGRLSPTRRARAIEGVGESKDGCSPLRLRPSPPPCCCARRTASAQPATLTLGTASGGGTYFVYGEAMAKILTEKAKLQVVPQQTQGPNQNMILVDEKKIELGMVTMGVALQGLTGTGALDQGQEVRKRTRALPDVRHAPAMRGAEEVGHHELQAARRQDGRHRSQGRHRRHLFPADLRGAGHEGAGAQRPERRHGQPAR